MIFNYLYKKKATKLRVTFKTFRGKKSSFIGKVDFRENVHLLDVHDRFDVIKVFHLFLYSIEINLLNHVLWDKIRSRTIGELNLS